MNQFDSNMVCFIDNIVLYILIRLLDLGLDSRLQESYALVWLTVGAPL